VEAEDDLEEVYNSEEEGSERQTRGREDSEQSDGEDDDEVFLVLSTLHATQDADVKGRTNHHGNEQE
jgi:hypothetical protein